MTKPIVYESISDCVGKTFAFYGVDNYCFKLGDTVWKALAEEQDEYRNNLLDIIPTQDKGMLFFKKPLATVEVVLIIPALPHKGESRPLHATLVRDMAGYALRDVADKHIWLTVGTRDFEDYYPYFVFEYAPKQPTVHAAEEQAPV